MELLTNHRHVMSDVMHNNGPQLNSFFVMGHRWKTGETEKNNALHTALCQSKSTIFTSEI